MLSDTFRKTGQRHLQNSFLPSKTKRKGLSCPRMMVIKTKYYDYANSLSDMYEAFTLLNIT